MYFTPLLLHRRRITLLSTASFGWYYRVKRNILGESHTAPSGTAVHRALVTGRIGGGERGRHRRLVRPRTYTQENTGGCFGRPSPPPERQQRHRVNHIGDNEFNLNDKNCVDYGDGGAGGERHPSAENDFDMSDRGHPRGVVKSSHAPSGCLRISCEQRERGDHQQNDVSPRWFDEMTVTQQNGGGGGGEGGGDASECSEFNTDGPSKGQKCARWWVDATCQSRTKFCSTGGDAIMRRHNAPLPLVPPSRNLDRRRAHKGYRRAPSVNRSDVGVTQTESSNRQRCYGRRHGNAGTVRGRGRAPSTPCGKPVARPVVQQAVAKKPRWDSRFWVPPVRRLWFLPFIAILVTNVVILVKRALFNIHSSPSRVLFPAPRADPNPN